ncbi:MAG TPA: hypothetical protein VF823_00545 [Anaerolineales bacterium]
MHKLWIGLLILILAAGCAAPAQPSPTAAPVSPSPAPTLPPPTATPVPPEPTETPIPLAPGQELIPDVSLVNSIDLADKWRFSQVKAFSESLTQPGFDDSQWAETSAPAGWDAQGLADQVGKGTIVIYRRTVDVPAGWKGKPAGIHAWFNPFASRVFVNGQQVDPARTPFAAYADVSDLLKYGESNSIAVITQYDGFAAFAEDGPARIGLIEDRPVTKIMHDDLSVDTPDGKSDATLTYPAEKKGLPGLVLVATGSHGMGEKVNWNDLADDLARQGYASLAIALTQQKQEDVLAAVKFLSGQPMVNPDQLALFGVDQSCEAAVQAAVQTPNLKGLILLSPPQVIDEASGLSKMPLLIMASQGDRNGLILDQVKETAAKAGNAQVASLPGDGHGTFIITNTWNALRQALLSWLKQNMPSQ